MDENEIRRGKAEESAYVKRVLRDVQHAEDERPLPIYELKRIMGRRIW